MKKKIKAGAAVLMLLSVLALASCSMVFYGGLSGKVIDKDNNGLADVKVYLYLDKGQWEAAKDGWKGYAGFDPKGFYKDTYTLENGTYAFDKVMWETSSSEFGKEADREEAYLIFVSKDYGMESQTVKILSESKNTASPQIMEKKTDTFTYRVSFRNEADTSEAAASRWTLTYSYAGKPGESEVFTDDVAFEGSELIIPVTYYKKSETGDKDYVPQIPEVTLSKIRCTETQKKKVGDKYEDVAVWEYVGENPVLKAEADEIGEKSVTVNMKKKLDTETFTYRVNFVNAGDADESANSRYTFKYSYDGRPDTEKTYESDTVTVTGSAVEIPVTYYKGESVPSVKLFDVKSSDMKTHDGKEIARWRMVDDANAVATEITFAPESEKTERTVYLKMQEMWWQLPGFSGEVMDKDGKPIANAKVTVNDGSEDIVTRNVRTEYDNGNLIRSSFAGLADDQVIYRTADTEVTPLKATYTLKATGKVAGAAVNGTVTVDAVSTDADALTHIVIEAL